MGGKDSLKLVLRAMAKVASGRSLFHSTSSRIRYVRVIADTEINPMNTWI